MTTTAQRQHGKRIPGRRRDLPRCTDSRFTSESNATSLCSETHGKIASRDLFTLLRDVLAGRLNGEISADDPFGARLARSDRLG
jgi:hypothetical protein